MRCTTVGLALVFLALLAPPVSAQVPWESPLLLGPGSPGGVSLFLVDPGDGLGGMVQWQGRERERRLGFRAGVAEDHQDDLAAFGGVDFTGSLLTHSEEFPLDLIWVTGMGLGIGDAAVISIPVGVSLGRVLTERNLWFHPYVSTRLVVDAFLGEGDSYGFGGGGRRGGDDDLELGLVVDFGADFSFAGSWALRIGASVGDREGLAVGFSIG